MLIVALTGGIACGKSQVSRILSEKGCFVQRADLIARELMSPGTAVWKDIVDHFGPSILTEDGCSIDRARLGAIVFSDEAERSVLNAIVHPRVLEEKKETIARLDAEGRIKIFVSEAALVFEAGYSDFYDKIVVVSCSAEIQVRRLMARDAIDRQEALKKIRSQWPQDEKIGRADYVIDTSGNFAEMIEQTERVHAWLLRDYENKMACRKT